MTSAGSAWSGLVTFPVVGVYDGSDQGNVVDRDAGFYAGNSSGVGDDDSLVLKIDSFRDEIRKAFDSGRGGVIGFDNAVITGGTQTDTFAASFGGGKSLIVKSVDHIRTDFVADNICVPISGPVIDSGVATNAGAGAVTNGGFLAKSIVGADSIKIRSSFNFSFTENGFAEGEHVRVVAGTILGRNGAAEESKWLMKVTLDNGDIIAQIADINFRSGNARDDTFFGARAPNGHYITSVMWINLDGNYSGLDGFAFITNGEPPKPRPQPTRNNTDPDNPSFFGIPYGGSGGSDDDSSGEYSSLFGSSRPSSRP